MGVFVCRGPDIKPVVEAAPDWESYTYEKIDLADEKQKAFFEAAMAWDLEIDGKAWADGKNVSFLQLFSLFRSADQVRIRLVQVDCRSLLEFLIRLLASFFVLYFLDWKFMKNVYVACFQ